MKIRSLSQLAVFVIIGLEQLRYSLAFGGEFELPFKVPFHDAVGEIHRSFPMQTKYISDLLLPKPVQREEAKPDPSTISESSTVKKQLKDAEPKVETPIIPSEVKQPLTLQKKILLETYASGQEEEIDKRVTIIDGSLKMLLVDQKKEDNSEKEDESPEEEEDSESSEKEEEDDDDDSKKEGDDDDDDSEKEDDDDDSSEKDEEEDGDDDTSEDGEDVIEFVADDGEMKTVDPEMETTDEDSQKEKIDSDEYEKKKEEISRYLYRMTLVIEGPGGRTVSHLKTGYITPETDDIFIPDDIQSVMRNMVESGKELKCVPISDVSSRDAKKKEEVAYAEFISLPNAKYTSETMDKKGNIFRQERIRPLPISFRSYHLNRPIITAHKQIAADMNTQEPNTPSDKEATEEPKYTLPESTDDSVNEISDDLEEKPNTWRKVRDSAFYPKKYKNFNYHIEPEASRLVKKQLSYSELEGKSSVLKESYARKFDEEIKKPLKEFDIKISESEAKVPDSQEPEGKSSASKEPNFDDEDDEGVKRIVVIQPRVRVFHASVDIPKQKESPELPPIRAQEELPVKAQKVSLIGAQETSSVKVQEKSPLKTQEESPLKTQEVSPVKAQEESPVNSQKVLQTKAQEEELSVGERPRPTEVKLDRVKNDEKLEKLPFKHTFHDASPFYRQLWSPLKHILNTKIFGRPAGLVIPP